MKLTDEMMRVKIAEACGFVPCDQWKPFNSQSMMKGNCGHKNCYPRNSPPHYESSLEAMHEAEKVLTDGQRYLYGEALADLLSGVPELYDDVQLGGYDIYQITHATAAQRAEAFCRTLGLTTNDSQQQGME